MTMTLAAFEQELQHFAAEIQSPPVADLGRFANVERRLDAAEKPARAWRQRLTTELGTARRLFLQAEQEASGQMMREMSDKVVPAIVDITRTMLKRLQEEGVERAKVELRLRSAGPQMPRPVVKSIAKRVEAYHQSKIESLENVILRLTRMRIDHDPDLHSVGVELSSSEDVDTWLDRLAAE